MNRSHLSEAITAIANRLKAATLGFGITVAPLAIAALVQFALMPQIVGPHEGLTHSEQTGAISASRREWLIVHAIAATLFAVYWLLTAMFGKGQLLRLRAANVTLALCLLIYLCQSVYYAFIPWPHDLHGILRGICSVIGISDEVPNPYGFDAQSDCDAFVYTVHIMTQLGLFGLSIILLVASVIIRVVSSHLASPAEE